MSVSFPNLRDGIKKTFAVFASPLASGTIDSRKITGSTRDDIALGLSDGKTVRLSRYTKVTEGDIKSFATDSVYGESKHRMTALVSPVKDKQGTQRVLAILSIK